MSNPQWNRARQSEMDSTGSRLYEYEQYEIGSDERGSGDVAPLAHDRFSKDVSTDLTINWS